MESHISRSLSMGSRLAAVIVFACAWPFPALAADGTWSLTNNNGNWVTGGNWVGSVIPGSTTATNSTDAAYFSALLTGANRTVTVDANRNIQNITFDAGNSGAFGYTLSGGSLLLTSGGTIAATGGAGAHTDTISSPMTIVGNNATYRFNNDSTLATRLLSISGGITGRSTTGGTTTVVLGGSGLATGTNNFSSALLSGSFGGSMALVKEGSATWYLAAGSRPGLGSGTALYPVTINGGKLVYTEGSYQGRPLPVTLADVAGAQLDIGFSSNATGLASLAGGGSLGGNVNLTGGSGLFTVGFDSTSTTYGGRIINGGNFTNFGMAKVGFGTLTLTGSGNDAGGSWRVVQGGLTLDFSQASTGSNILVTTRSLDLQGGRLGITGSSGASNSQAFSSTALSNATSIALTSNGAAGLVVSLGAITRNAGSTLDVTLADNSQSATNGIRTTTSTMMNGVLATAASNGVAYATVSGTTWAAASAASGTVSIVPLATYATTTGSYTTNNNVDVANGDSPSAFTVNTLRLNGNNTLNLTGTNTVAAGGVLVTTAASTGATISGGVLRAGGGRELVFHNYGSQLTIGSVIADSSSGSSSLVLSGTGLYLLNGSNIYTGATSILSGTVRAGSGQALGAGSAVTVGGAGDSRATLELNGNDLSIGSLSGGGGGRAGNAYFWGFVNGGLVSMGSNALTVGSLNTNTTFSGSLTGSGTLTKVGTGQLLFGGTSALAGFSGAILLQSGTLSAGQELDRLTGADAFGSASQIVLGTNGSVGATLGVNGAGTRRPILLATGNTGTATIAINDVGTTFGSSLFSFQSIVTGTGNLVFAFPQSLTSNVSGTTNNVGSVTFDDRGSGNNKTQLVSAEIGSNVTDVTVKYAGTYAGHTFTGPLRNTGALLFTGPASSIVGSGVTVSGTISAISSLTLDANYANRLILSAANTFSAPVSIQTGTLQASSSQALGINNPVTLGTATSAGLRVNNEANLAIGSLAGGGASGGNVEFGNSNSRLTTGGANTSTTFAGSASGAGGFTKVGTGTFTLSGSTSNTGTNAVNEGTLRLAAAGAISTAHMNVGNSGVLDLAVNTTTTGTVTMSGSAATILGTGTLTAPAYAFTNSSGRSLASVVLTGTGGVTKSGAGIAVLSGANSYSGTTSITGGVLSITSTAALPGWNTAGRYVTSAGGALVVGNDVTDADFNTIRTTGSFAANAAIGFDTSAGNRTYAGTAIANIGSGTIGLMKIGSGTLTMGVANTYTGTTTVREGVLRLGVAGALPANSPLVLNDTGLGSGSLDLAVSATAGAVTVSGSASSLFGVGTLTGSSFAFSNSAGTVTASAVLGGTAATLTKSNAGTLVLSGLNNYQGKTTVSGGVLEFNSIADAGTANFSALGAPAVGAGATIDFGSSTAAATLRYVGTGHASNRVLNLSGTGNVTIEAIGSGPLVLTGTNTDGGSGTRTFTLNATGTSLNQIGPIAGNGVSVTKTGSGLWRLTGNNSYNGRLTVLDGTVVVATSVAGVGSNSPFGGQITGTTNPYPLIGDSSATASGTVALLAEGVSVARGAFITASSGSQTVVIGGVGSGTATYSNSSAMRLGRGVTLQASTGGTVVFENSWQDFSGGANPAVAFTVGSSGNAGTVAFNSDLPNLATALNVANGTAQLMNNNDRIDPTTPVTVGSTLGAATLDLNGFSQSLSRLTFAGNSGSVTTGNAAGGMLRLVNSGSVSVSGTGHMINSLVDLVVPTTFDTNSASVLTVSSVISSTSGDMGLTKAGLGTLTLSAANTYTGATLVTAGQLRVNGRLGNTAVTVQSGGTLGGSGVLGGSLTGDGLIAPGNSPGILTVEGQLTPTGSTSFAFELSGTGSPTWNNATASVNDVLRLTNADPFTSILGSGNVVNVYFDVASLSAGDMFLGGFFIDNPNETPNLLTSELGTATFAYFVRGTGSGATVYNETSYLPLADYMLSNPGITGVTRSVENVASANFTGGTITTGQVTQFVIVPEPASLAMAGIGIATAAYVLRRRR
jgi:autotransporter-associated beta strand protein